MSYSSQTKEELCRFEPDSVCCLLAELSGIVCAAGSVIYRGGGDKRRKAADDEIHQKLAVLDAQRLYLLDHPYLSSLPQIREMMYLGLPFISS